MSTDRSRSTVRRGSAVLATSVLLLATAACQQEAEPSEPRLDDASSAAPSSDASAPEESAGPTASGPPELGETISSESEVHVGQLPASGKKRAAADAFVAYLQERARTFSTAQLDLQALSAVASGEALQGVQSYLSQLTESGHTAVGDSWLEVRKVAIGGNQGRRVATLNACVDNGTAEVDAQGRAVESPPPAYDLESLVAQVASDVWVVTTFEASARDGECSSDT